VEAWIAYKFTSAFRSFPQSPYKTQKEAQLRTAKALYWKFETNIPRNETARPRSQFLHSFMYLWAIYILPQSVRLFISGNTYKSDLLCSAVFKKINYGGRISDIGALESIKQFIYDQAFPPSHDLAPPPHNPFHPFLSAWDIYGVRSPKFIWAPCHVMCTAVLIGWEEPATPPPPPTIV
jgi:hypothetical protein